MVELMSVKPEEMWAGYPADSSGEGAEAKNTSKERKVVMTGGRKYYGLGTSQRVKTI
jgi:hypothetical protein